MSHLIVNSYSLVILTARSISECALFIYVELLCNMVFSSIWSYMKMSHKHTKTQIFNLSVIETVKKTHHVILNVGVCCVCIHAIQRNENAFDMY